MPFEPTILSGMQLNRNDKFVKSIINRIQLNDGYCPCDQGDTPKEDTKCPCKKYRQTLECCCNLYQKLSQ
jgi:hypothetical protein